MNSSLRWLYAITLASLLLHPTWLMNKAQADRRVCVSLSACVIEPVSQSSDFTLEEHSGRQGAELLAKYQKQVLPMWSHWVAAYEFTPPEARLAGSLVDAFPLCGGTLQHAAFLIRGPPLAS